jgi:hypothetical protein
MQLYTVVLDATLCIRYFLPHSVQTGTETHSESYVMGPMGSPSGGRAAEVWTSPLSSI